MFDRHFQLARLAIVAAAVLFVATAATRSHADPFISGFEGDLQSTLGPGWEVAGTLPPAEFVPALSEGAQAVQIVNNPDTGSWPAFTLNGGEALAMVMAKSRSLVFDVAPGPNLAWRQVFLIYNADNGWDQSPQYDLTPPGVDDPFDHIVRDLAASGWQTKAQQWLAATEPADREYFQFSIVIQGANWDASTPQTIFDNVHFLAADLGTPDGYVDAGDLSAWQTSFGASASGDADADGDTDGADLLVWQRELDPPTPAGVSAVPEPSTAMLLSGGLLLTALRRRR